MPGMESYLANPDNQMGLSGFLLGLGQGLIQSQQAGMAPLAGLAYGIGQGGQGAFAMRGQMAQERLRKLQEEVLRQKTEERARNEALGGQIAGAMEPPDSENVMPPLANQLAQRAFAAGNLDVGMKLMPKAQEDYTLAPGQARFNARGRPIAAMPDRPQRPVVVPPGSIAVDVEGNELFRAPEKPERPVAVPPGAALVDPKTGKPVYQQPDRPEKPGAPINIQMPDGTVRSFRPNDPALDDAIAAGGVRFTVQTPEVPAARRDEITANADRLDRTLQQLDTVRNAIVEDPTRAGLVGGVRGAIQTGRSLLGEAANLIPQVKRATDWAGVSTDRASTQTGISGYFDAVLAQMGTSRNDMAYSLAAARKGGFRLNEKDVELALKDLNLQGLTSVNDVLSRIDEVTREISTARDDMRSRLPKRGSAGGPQRGVFNPATGRIE